MSPPRVSGDEINKRIEIFTRPGGYEGKEEKMMKAVKPAKIEKYLNHYQQQEFITRYTMEKDGITIHW